jgi:poly(3-hydroxybutyrate) depolymerase
LTGAAAGGGRGGAAGSGSAGSGAGGGAVAMPSAGCGRMTGKPTSASVANAIVTFPDAYDGNTPMPLVFGFHGAGRTNDQFRTVDARTQGTDLEKHFVMVYLKAAGSGWVVNTDTARVNTAFDTMKSMYCIDQNRVFATGHSSGAQMITQMLCANDRRFRAVAPVASSAYCTKWNNPLPVLLIHGKNDSERASTSQDADGRKDLAPYVSSSMCGTTTTPYDVAGCTSGSTQVVPGCVSYSACQAPLVWCQHNDPNYSNTNHGWPCFANKAMHDFFLTF